MSFLEVSKISSAEYVKTAFSSKSEKHENIAVVVLILTITYKFGYFTFFCSGRRRNDQKFTKIYNARTGLQCS